MTKALVLLSGGQDSTTCWYWALDRYDVVEAVSFDYGQRHRIELDLAEQTATKTGRARFVIPIEALNVLGGGSLTNPEIENTAGGETAPSGWHHDHDLPPSFVPGRNALFFTLAAAYGIPRGFERIVTGVCQQDRSGYPDCREEFVVSMEMSIRLAMDTPRFTIDAPLLDRTKAETFQLAQDLGVLNEILCDTSTCYEGNRSDPPKPWGYGCGVCGACTERIRGYDEFRAAEGARRFATT